MSETQLVEDQRVVAVVKTETALTRTLRSSVAAGKKKGWLGGAGRPPQRPRSLLDTFLLDALPPAAVLQPAESKKSSPWKGKAIDRRAWQSEMGASRQSATQTLAQVRPGSGSKRYKSRDRFAITTAGGTALLRG